MVNIAVFIPNKFFFGHLILQIPFFDRLKHRYPNSNIVVYSTIKQAFLFKEIGICDEVILYKKGSVNFRLIKQLFKLKPTHIYNLRPYSFYIQSIIGLFVKAYKVGFATDFASNWFYNKAIAYDTSIYKSCLYLSLLDSKMDDHSFSYFKQTSNPVQFKESRFFIMMPGGGEGEHKKWGIENFLMLSELILNEIPDTRIVFILGPSETEEKKYIAKSAIAGKCSVFECASISTIAALARMSKAVIANDCGPSHIAQMAGCNYIGIWGWEKQHPVLRIAEWTYPSDTSVQIVAKYGTGIKTISPQRIYQQVKCII